MTARSPYCLPFFEFPTDSVTTFAVRVPGRHGRSVQLHILRLLLGQFLGPRDKLVRVGEVLRLKLRVEGVEVQGLLKAHTPKRKLAKVELRAPERLPCLSREKARRSSEGVSAIIERKFACALRCLGSLCQVQGLLKAHTPQRELANQALFGTAEEDERWLRAMRRKRVLGASPRCKGSRGKQGKRCLLCRKRKRKLQRTSDQVGQSCTASAADWTAEENERGMVDSKEKERAPST